VPLTAVRTTVKVLRHRLDFYLFQYQSRGQEKWLCPACGFRGAFREVQALVADRKHARCPQCGSLERHRLQTLVLNELQKRYDFSNLSLLHFAPEPHLGQRLKRSFKSYATADLYRSGVDFKEDVRKLQQRDASYDVVYASHLLEHVDDDAAAISEIRRILKPGGFAVLPVPIYAEKTVEYGKPNPYEADHVRAPGTDYFQRYARSFSRVETFSSEDFPAIYQTYLYQDRTLWPTEKCPQRPYMEGEKHADVVPVCFV